MLQTLSFTDPGIVPNTSLNSTTLPYFLEVYSCIYPVPFGKPPLVEFFP